MHTSQNVFIADAGEGVRFLALDDIPLEALDKTPGRCLQGRCVLTQKRTGLTRELAGQGLRLLAQQALWRGVGRKPWSGAGPTLASAPVA